jgi:carbon-monoxide dehydrogenase small subunit
MTVDSRVIRFTLNGESVTADVPTHWNVVELLQNRFGLFGARESCGQGLCGCCTVLVNGAAVSGCLYLAALVDGADVRTIEQPVQSESGLDAVQEAFIECGAFQCGFCTPGMIFTTRALLEGNSNPSAEQIRHALEGNMCRCTGYQNIVRSVQAAAAAGGR